MIIFHIILSFSLSFLQCSDYFLSKVCSFEKYDRKYNQSLSLSFSNPLSDVQSDCQTKNLTHLKRKVFICNYSNLHCQNRFGYDSYYISLATALETESRIAFTNLISAWSSIFSRIRFSANT